MAFDRLPNELLLSVAQCLDKVKDINSFAQTNVRTYNLLNSYLYRYDAEQHGSLALLWAAKYGQEGTARKSLEEGGNAQSTFHDNETPIMSAAINGHAGMIQLLLAAGGVDPNSKDSIGNTPLSFAAWNGHEAAVKLLLGTEGVDPDSKDSIGNTPLLLAARNGHVAVVKLLLAAEGVDPNSKAVGGLTPLLWAEMNGHQSVIELIQFQQTGRYF